MIIIKLKGEYVKKSDKQRVNMERKRVFLRLLSIFITLSVVISLFLSAPAEAFILGINIPGGQIEKGQVITSKLTVKSEPNDGEVSFINFKLVGHKTFDCQFDVNGSIIKGCEGISINKTSSSMYSGYGYGYVTETDLEYELTMDTGKFYPDTYSTFLIVQSGNKNKKQRGSDLKIINSSPSVPIKDCSLRAKNGAASIENVDFGSSNKINFYVPVKSARSGEGYITGQKGRNTFNYKFDIDEVIENNNDRTVIAVSGKYRVGIGNYVDEKSVITLEKKKNMINVIGDNVNIVYMDVEFKDGCTVA